MIEADGNGDWLHSSTADGGVTASGFQIKSSRDQVLSFGC
jgi:hypothetical protein